MKAILRGTDDNAIATFNASHRAIKDAIKRAVEIEQALAEPQLYDLDRARRAQSGLWSFLNQEPDISAAPQRVHRLLRWCLEKDRKKRLASISDARRLLVENEPATSAADAPSRRRSWHRRRRAPSPTGGAALSI